MFSSVNTCWTLVGAFLVYFMQAGFALCEAGFTRAKNTGNILMKNMMDFCIGTPCYWLIGFGLMFGGTGALIGGFDPFIQGDYSHLGLDIPLWVYIVFQTVFCATAATIVSGSMAERTNFKAYCVYSAAISLVVYPICGHWMWGGGWLQSMGFHDFAGSAAVHNVGGVIALLGAWMLGPRIGKYDKDGNPHAIPGHNLTAGALGVFILWFCWFGFNGGSSLSLATDEAMTMTGLVCFNTNLAAAVATCVTMIFTWLRYGKPDVSMTLNGSLAGLVAITAGCDTVSPFGAFFIGFVAGILVVLSVEFFDKIAKVDDPVGAVSVHFANGVWGTIAVGLFSDGGNGVGKGLFYGGGFNPIPDSRPDNGKLEFLVVRDVSRLTFIRLVGKYAKGRYRELANLITHLEGDHLEIDSETELVVNVDGEALWSKHVNFDLIPGGVNFLVPANMAFFHPETAGGHETREFVHA